MARQTKTQGKVVPLRPRKKPSSVALPPQQAKALRKQDAAHLVHGFVPLGLQQNKGVPVFVKGQGIYLWDTEGKQYIDGLASLWNVHIGHGRKEINRAVAEQMNKLALCAYADRPDLGPDRATGGQAGQDRTQGPEPGDPDLGRLGVERIDDSSGPRLLESQREAQEDEVHHPGTGLSRHLKRCRVADRDSAF